MKKFFLHFPCFSPILCAFSAFSSDIISPPRKKYKRLFSLFSNDFFCTLLSEKQQTFHGLSTKKAKRFTVPLLLFGPACLRRRFEFGNRLFQCFQGCFAIAQTIVYRRCEQVFSVGSGRLVVQPSRQLHLRFVRKLALINKSEPTRP